MRGVQSNVFKKSASDQLKPVIDSAYDFSDIAKAHIQTKTGHVSGKLVIAIYEKQLNK